jgi:hypothetical protein
VLRRKWACVFSSANRPVFFAATSGLASFTLGCLLIATGTTGGLTLAVLGTFLWFLAGAANRLQHLVLKAFGAHLEARLAEKEHGDEFADAAKNAPDSVLEAVIPLLREDVASDVLELPDAYAGKRLVDPELAWLRQELNVTVFAINRPGDGDAWTGGGRVSTLPLPAGTKLAVLGEAPDIAAARARLSP